MAKDNTIKQNTFEDSLKKLEEIAYNLENGDLKLDESIKAFEKGMELSKFCHQKLEEAERKIELLQKSENGSVKKKTVQVDDDSGELNNNDELQGSLL